MFMPNVIRGLQSSQPLRSHQQVLMENILKDPLLRVFPALRTLPFFATEAEITDFDALLQDTHLLTIHGATGSGRSLLLLQMALHVLATSQFRPTLLLPLAAIDQPDMNPLAIVVPLFKTTGLLAQHTLHAVSRRPWMLLVDEWELLPAVRRTVWKNFLLNMAQTWIETQIVITLPLTEEPWQQARTVTLPPPTSQHIQRWLHHLLPEHERAPLQASLERGATLAACANRLLEPVLLALTSSASEVPASRLQLYEQAYRRWQILTQAEQSQAGDLAPPAEQPAISIVELAQAMTARLSSRMVSCYEQAQQLATSGEFTSLLSLPFVEQHEVVLLLVHAQADPSPLYTLLWNQAEEAASAPHLEMLGRCLLERPADAFTADWILPVLEALVAQQTVPRFQQLLQDINRGIPALLRTVSSTSEGRWLALLEQLVPLLDAPALLAVVDDAGLPPYLRWQAADALHTYEHTHALLHAPPPPDALAQAIRCHVLALGDSASRQALAKPAAAPWIIALQGPHVSQERRFQIARTLVQDQAIPPVLRATALAVLSLNPDETTLSILQQMAAEQESLIRYAALTALRNHPASQALPLLQNIILDAQIAWEVRRDALAQVEGYAHSHATMLLARCSINTALPLTGRLQAVEYLAKRSQQSSKIVCQILAAPAIHVVVRAKTARLLGNLATEYALETLRQVARSSAEPSQVRQAALFALATITRCPNTTSQQRERVLHVLLHVHKEPCGDSLLKACTLHALGILALPDCVPVLRHVLLHATAEDLLAAWLEAAPHLASVPLHEWHRHDLPPDTRVALLTALTEGDMEAEQPGSLDELVVQTALQLRMAAASALTRIATSADEETYELVHESLMTALQQPRSHDELRRLLSSLKAISQTQGLQEMEEIFANPASDATVRWLLVEQFGNSSALLPLMLHYLHDEQIDAVTRGMIAQTLGHYGTEQAIHALLRLAKQPTNTMPLRLQALASLESLDTPLVTETCLTLIAETNAAPTLRRAAARALPSTLSPDTRHWLRELLRTESTPAELIEGIIAALARAHDRQALALMLRYAQSETSSVALRALTALASMGDNRIAPTLVRIAQNTHTEMSIRLEAVITLLRLCGESYLPFLRSFLDCDLLPLQLHALDELLVSWSDYAQPLILVANRAAPLALRLRALQDVIQRNQSHHVLHELLLDGSTPLQLRVNIASLLGQAGGVEAIKDVVQCIQDGATTPYLRRHGIRALEQQAQSTSAACVTAARLALGEIAEHPALAEETRAWASEALERGSVGAA